MDDIEFKVSQRPWLLAWSAICFALLAGAIVDLVTGARVLRGDVRVTFIVVGAIAGLALVDLAVGKTAMTATTLSTSSLFYRRACAWADIERVELVEEPGRAYYAWIYIYPVSGRPIRLRAPFSSRQRSNHVLDDVISTVESRRVHAARRRLR